VAAVKQELVGKLSYVCPGFYQRCKKEAENCHTVCQQDAIEHSW